MSTWQLLDPTSDVAPATRIGRQGIYDRDHVRVASELLFRGRYADHAGLPSTWDAVRDDSVAQVAALAAADQATSHVIVSTFGDFGVDRLSGGKPLFLNVTRSFLVGDYPLPFGPENIVLEILETVPVDDEVLAGIATLRGLGFRFALDDYVGEPHRCEFLPLVDVVKVDVLAAGVDAAAIAREVRLSAPGAQVLAERVETAQVMQQCLDAGFDLFQGYHLAYPDVLEAASLSPSQVVCLRLLQALGDPESDVDEVEDIVATDPGLAVRVLRTANSASSGSRRSISSLRQAVVLLGPGPLRSWILLTLLGGLATGRRDDLETILVRAEACEAVARATGADHDAAYTTGLLSGIAQVLRTHGADVARDAGVGDDVTAALSDGGGAIGAVLRVVRAHELDLPDAADGTGLSPLELSSLYLASWAKASATVAAMLGS